MTLGFIGVAPEVTIVFDFCVVVYGVKLSFVVHLEESGGVVFDVVNEEDAIEVVDFVEEGAGEGAFGFDADRSAVFEECLDLDFGGAFNEAVDEGNREATFVIFFGFAFGFDDFWVDEGGEVDVLFVFEVVTDDDNAAVKTELRGGHGSRKFVRVSFFPVEGSFAHVGDDVSSFFGDCVDLATFLTEARVGRRDNFHELIIS